MGDLIAGALAELQELGAEELLRARYERFRRIGVFREG